MPSRQALMVMAAAANLRGRRRRRPRRPPKPRFPHGIQNGYRRQLRTIFDAFREIAIRIIGQRIDGILQEARAGKPTSRTDDAADSIEAMMNAVLEEFGDRYPAGRIQDVVRARASELDRYNRQDLNRIFSVILGVEPFGGETWVETQMNMFVKQNANLITDTANETKRKVEQIVMSSARAGERWEEIQDKINAVMKVSESRAELIARDQVSKFNGELTELRQTEAGIDQYRWSTSRDERVRGNPAGLYPDANPSHWDKEGQIFNWSDPPEDTGHPGQDYQCRCVAIPVVPEV